MNKILLILIVFLLTLYGVNKVIAVEEVKYKVMKKDKSFELREYDSYLVAEVLVDSNREEAGNKAFRYLFKYISGENKAEKKISMTAPMSQMKMDNKWAVSFMMPAKFSMENIPEPDNSRVKIKKYEKGKIAAIKYSGKWDEKNYLSHEKKLLNWVKSEKLKETGNPIWARYNPPMTPWFMRRNEILIPVK